MGSSQRLAISRRFGRTGNKKVFSLVKKEQVVKYVNGEQNIGQG
jgi:hypothetical protein